MLAEQAHELSIIIIIFIIIIIIIIICHDCGKVRRYRSGCTVPGKACARVSKPAVQMKKVDRGVALGKSGVPCTRRLRAWTASARTSAPTRGSPARGDCD